MTKNLFSWQDFNGSVVQSNMDNAFLKKKHAFRKKAPVYVIKVFFLLWNVTQYTVPLMMAAFN